ncbi:MAG: class I SAM-dependent methyltransferase [Candidatus Schekmanbacteria bacterium]|nr:class I SAM-dependent methyltransferase [Candidatus Schekmanbacteria bacterium]
MGENTIRIARNNRLLYFKEEPTQEFWADHWEQYNSYAGIEFARNGCLSNYYGDILLKYLPQNGKILEGGCGVGDIVVALKARGFDIVGIEFSEEVVIRVNKLFPDIPIKVGNILSLEYPDNYFSAYISFGVLEHFQAGPEAGLREAKRVIKNNGYLIVSVPYFSPLRKLKANLGYYKGKNDHHLPFYQYALSKHEFAHTLVETGFSIERIHYYDSFKGIKDEVSLIGFLNRKGLISNRIQKYD